MIFFLTFFLSIKFVAHSYCQQKIFEIWYTGIRKVSKMNQLFVLMLTVAFICMVPFNSIIYIFAPKSKVTLLVHIFKPFNNQAQL